MEFVKNCVNTKSPKKVLTNRRTTQITMNLINSSSANSALISRVQLGFARQVVSFTARIRRKGARRRAWWHPKLLRNRLYKGYGSGTMMTAVRDAETGEITSMRLDPEKVREYIVPDFQARPELSNLKPYVAAGTPIVEVPKITEWDYLKKMEESWGPESQAVFDKLSKLSLGKKSGKFTKFGS